MSEARFQHEIVKYFTNNYPEYRGLLFMVDNSTYSLNHTQKKYAIGMVAGVSDLILISPLTGICNGIEVKSPNSKHKKQQIITELEWGKSLIKNGGNYIMSSDFNEIKIFIDCCINSKKYYFDTTKVLCSF